MGSDDRQKPLQGNAPKQHDEPNAAEKVSGRISATQNGQGSESTLIGDSDAFAALLEMIQSIAHRRCCVTITGETGTGKEMVARKIHDHSDRYDKPFVPVDCTTLTGQLFESQLFGHVKGAFTGAIHDTLGFFRAADKGTIFLDEISEIPLELQAKLLRVLQEGSVTPVGSTQAYPIDVRILCATNRDLKKMVDTKEFRPDLYYRVNVVNLEIPPLRQRSEDILPLAKHFLANIADFYDETAKILSSRTEEMLLKYHWPGNVREMANAMERCHVLTKSGAIEPSVLPAEVLMFSYAETHADSPLPTLDAAKERLITEALKVTGGRKVATARILGIDRRKLNRLIQRLNITVPK
ncbi:MAG: sigma-54-dependent Fis family transcriptional regulator [Planctomycetes bacterium]|nr:sigma-54-dependent Fis family transcriptional regulator [Planctomycetota bacterium]